MKRKSFKMDLEKDLPNMLDAVFVGNHDHQPNGWVMMNVNDKGRVCVEALFPEGRFRWRDPCTFDLVPADWLGFEIHVPGTVAALETKLPLEIVCGADLSKANPDALAFLLAVGVVRQGGRAGVFHDGRMEIIQLTNHGWH